MSRIYVLGTLFEPEQLKKTFGDYETIGQALTEACVTDKLDSKPWNHELLKHNIEEAKRLREALKDHIFT